MNKQNFDKTFNETISNLTEEKPKLLLHTCCAPCATYCLTKLLPYFDVTLYYSNDNITDAIEWQKRLDGVKRLVAIVNNGLFEVKTDVEVKLIEKPLESSNFFDAVVGFEGDKEGGNRCKICYQLRLADTASFAYANSFDYFCTTLTISPHKNSLWINEIGKELEEKSAVKFLQSDFKKNNGFLESNRLTNMYMIYRQNYCGCPFGQID